MPCATIKPLHYFPIEAHPRDDLTQAQICRVFLTERSSLDRDFSTQRLSE